jgi:hypothetical protein
MKRERPLADGEGTCFLSVDLDIFSRVPLDPIVQAFGKKVLVLHVGRWGHHYSANVELLDCYRQNADRQIWRLVELVKKLPRSARRLWNDAEVKEFNIGIEAAVKSRLFELRLQPETLQAVASVDGRIVITVYAPVRLPSSPRSRLRRKK